MQAVGGTMVKHYRELAFMGFIEVVFNLKTILGNIKFCKQDIEQFNPDAIIFIDHPGFMEEYDKIISVIKTVVPESAIHSDDEEIMEFEPEP